MKCHISGISSWSSLFAKVPVLGILFERANSKFHSLASLVAAEPPLILVLQQHNIASKAFQRPSLLTGLKAMFCSTAISGGSVQHITMDACWSQIALVRK